LSGGSASNLFQAEAGNVSHVDPLAFPVQKWILARAGSDPQKHGSGNRVYLVRKLSSIYDKEYRHMGEWFNGYIFLTNVSKGMCAVQI
jgi:hypothetical protein